MGDRTMRDNLHSMAQWHEHSSKHSALCVDKLAQGVVTFLSADV